MSEEIPRRRVVAQSGPSRFLIEEPGGAAHVLDLELRALHIPRPMDEVRAEEAWTPFAGEEALVFETIPHVNDRQRRFIMGLDHKSKTDDECPRCGRRDLVIELRDAEFGAPREAFGEWIVCRTCGQQWPTDARVLLVGAWRERGAGH